MTTQTLTDHAIATLKGVCSTDDLSVDGAVITTTDKWGDSWTVLVVEDVESLDVADLLVHRESSDRLVLVVPAAGEVAARAALTTAGVSGAANSVLVWTQ